MRGIASSIVVILTALGVAACGTPIPQYPGAPSPEDVVIRARAVIRVHAGDRPTALQSSVPISIVNAANTSMALDTTGFVTPAVHDALLDFGFIGISSLMDNDLYVCGDSRKQKCKTALIRAYTIHPSGPGLYNAEKDYGVPVIMGLLNSLTEVGWLSSSATVLQSVSIPQNKRVLRLNDFSPIPQYQVQSDFSNAGAGAFETTLLLEYGLSL